MKKEKFIATKPMLTAVAQNSLIDNLVNEQITKTIKEREQFLKTKIEEHCKWWQKKYIKLAIKFGWNIWFIKNCIKNVPHELNSEFMGMNFGTQQQYGCEINGKVYWML